MTLRIQRSAEGEIVAFTLSGRIKAEEVAELQKLFGAEYPGHRGGVANLAERDHHLRRKHRATAGGDPQSRVASGRSFSKNAYPAGAKERQQGHPPLKRWGNGDPQGSSKGPAYSILQRFLQRKRKPDQCKGPSACFLFGDQEGEDCKTSLSRSSPHLDDEAHSGGSGSSYRSEAGKVENDLDGDALCPSSSGEPEAGD